VAPEFSDAERFNGGLQFVFHNHPRPHRHSHPRFMTMTEIFHRQNASPITPPTVMSAAGIYNPS
jgi:hypothetical protein